MKIRFFDLFSHENKLSNEKQPLFQQIGFYANKTVRTCCDKVVDDAVDEDFYSLHDSLNRAFLSIVPPAIYFLLHL